MPNGKPVSCQFARGGEKLSLSQLSLSPSAAARQAKAPKSNASANIGVLLLFLAAVVLFAAPKAWIVAVGIAVWGYLLFKSDGRAAAPRGGA